ncbi:MAG: Chromate resistance protein ChrB [Anaerolineaceae bacterium]
MNWNEFVRRWQDSPAGERQGFQTQFNQLCGVLGHLPPAEADYAQVIKSATRFVEHVERETSTEDFRFVEVESLEGEMEKVRRQLQRVIDRDHFDNAAREGAHAAVLAAERALSGYVELASVRGEA